MGTDPRGRSRNVLESIAMLVVIAISIVVIARGISAFRAMQASAAVPARAVAFEAITPVTVEIASSPVLGSDRAKIGIVVFSDFECPFCRAFATQVLPTLKGRFIDTGEVQLAFKHFPLTKIHSHALQAAEWSACLGNNDAFWRGHDFLFQNAKSLGVLTSEVLSESLQVDSARLNRCAVDSGARMVMEDVKLGTALAVPGTPTFFLGTIVRGRLNASRRLAGASTLPAFERAISEVVQ